MSDVTVAQEEVTTSESLPSWDDLKKKTFALNNLEGAKGYLAKFIHLEPVVKRNFNEWVDIPEGYQVVVSPIAKNDKTQKERIKTGMAIVACPTLALLLSQGDDSAAVKFVNGRVVDSMVNKAKSQIDSDEGMPFTIGDFVRSGRGDGTLAVYNELAPFFITALKEHGFKNLTSTILRRCLDCAEFALQQFPKVSQSNWEGLIQRFASAATNTGDDPAIFNDWLKTRDQKKIEEVEDFNLDELEISFNDDDEDTEDEVEAETETAS